MEEEICVEQKNVFAYGYIRRTVLAEHDTLVNFFQTQDCVIIHTNKRVSIFVLEDGCFVLHFQCYDDKVHQTYPRSEERNGVYNLALGYLAKTINDVMHNQFQETYVIFKEFVPAKHASESDVFIFEYIDYLFNFSYNVCIHMSCDLSSENIIEELIVPKIADTYHMQRDKSEVDYDSLRSALLEGFAVNKITIRSDVKYKLCMKPSP